MTANGCRCLTVQCTIFTHQRLCPGAKKKGRCLRHGWKPLAAARRWQNRCVGWRLMSPPGHNSQWGASWFQMAVQDVEPLIHRRSVCGTSLLRLLQHSESETDWIFVCAGQRSRKASKCHKADDDFSQEWNNHLTAVGTCSRRLAASINNSIVIVCCWYFIWRKSKPRSNTESISVLAVDHCAALWWWLRRFLAQHRTGSKQAGSQSVRWLDSWFQAVAAWSSELQLPVTFTLLGQQNFKRKKGDPSIPHFSVWVASILSE